MNNNNESSGADIPRGGVSRRSFVAQSSLMLAGSALGGRRLLAFTRNSRGNRRSLATVVVSPFPPEVLRSVAKTAIDVAVQAGAEWADIRLGEERRLYVLGDSGEVRLLCGYSLRVRVRGAEAFVTGSDPTVAAVTKAARSAVATAKSLISARRSVPADSLAKVPVVTGEWRVPMKIDPFAISIDDHVAATISGDGQFDRFLIRYQRQEGIAPGIYSQWRQGTRVFASSEGSLTTQLLTSVNPHPGMLKFGAWRAQRGEPFGLSGLSMIAPSSGGFELITHPDRFAQMQARVEELRRYLALPAVPLDIGRQDVVLDGTLHGQLVGAIVVPALSLNRALGNEIDVAGTSMFAPPESMRGQAVLPALLNCDVTPQAPNYGAAAWDEEGVASTSFPLVTNGVLTNYLSSRTTFPFQGANPGPLGGVTQSQLGALPTELPPSVTVAPDAHGGSMAELAKQMGNGILALGGGVATDPSGLGGYIYPEMMLEVRQGVVTRRTFGHRLMYSSRRVFKTLTALGDATTKNTAFCQKYSPGVPWVGLDHTVTAPAALYRNIDIVPHYMEAS